MNINTIDELALYELHDLEMLQARYKDQIRHARRSGSGTGDLEVELSYVQRELHIREIRERYIEKMNRASYREDIGV